MTLELDGLVRHYGEVVALDHLTFSVPPGQVFGFLGPNGAGKTTAMRAVFGLIALHGGAVRWKGAPITATERRRFGYMPEERGLYPGMLVGEQLRYLGRLHGMGGPEVDGAAQRWLERLGVADRAGDKVESLSHGNQQRVQLAAALVHDPELLVLDEPLAGLDPTGIDAIGEVLVEQAHAGRGVLFSSHQLDLVEDLCEDVVIIDHGRAVAAGTPAELKRRIGGKVVEVHTRSRQDLPLVANALGRLSRAGARTDEATRKVSIGLDGSCGLSVAIAAVEASGAEVEDVALRQPSLDEVFLTLTGDR